MSIKKQLAVTDLSDVKRDYAWYTVATLFNCEESSIRNIKASVAGMGLQDYVKEYFVPLRYAKKKGETKIRKIRGDYAGYAFIKCIMTATMWNLLRSASGVAVVLSSGGVPVEASDEAIDKIRQQCTPIGLSPREQEDVRRWNEKQYICKDVVKPLLYDEDFNTDFTT